MSLPEDNDEDLGRIIQAATNASVEIGLFSTAVEVYDSALNCGDEMMVQRLAAYAGQALPFIAELTDLGLSSSDIKDLLRDNLKPVISRLVNYPTIVVIGLESLVMDVLADQLTSQDIRLLSHSGKIDERRVESNLPRNIQIASVRDIISFGSPESIVVSYSFFSSHEGSFVYPLTLRAIGSDVQAHFGQIIALNFLRKYAFFPSSSHLTYIARPRDYFSDMIDVFDPQSLDEELSHG